MDLEDKALHQDLPLCLSPGAQAVPSVRPSSPTSAELHVLATSVIRRAAAADPQPLITIPEDLLKPTTHTGLYVFYIEGLIELCLYTEYNQICSEEQQYW